MVYWRSCLILARKFPRHRVLICLEKIFMIGFQSDSEFLRCWFLVLLMCHCHMY